jgi:hypothetical protein
MHVTPDNGMHPTRISVDAIRKIESPRKLCAGG